MRTKQLSKKDISLIKKIDKDYKRMNSLLKERVEDLVLNIIAPVFPYLELSTDCTFNELDLVVGAFSDIINISEAFNYRLKPDAKVTYYMDKNSDVGAFLEDIVYDKIGDLFYEFPLSFLEKSDSEVRKEMIKIRTAAEEEFLSSKSLEDFIADLKLNNDPKAKILAKLTPREREILGLS